MNIPFTRSELQAEAEIGYRNIELKRQVDQVYHTTLRTARNGEKSLFVPCSKEQSNRGRGIDIGAPAAAHKIYVITHADIIKALQSLFPDVTITSIEQKGTSQMVYQQAGILLDWS